MKFTKLQNFLKTKGIAARRFKILTPEERKKVSALSHYDVYQSELFYAPWQADQEFLNFFEGVNKFSLVSAPRCWILFCSIKQVLSLTGEFWECGVYKGGTALMLRKIRDALAPSRTIRLFDSFMGMPLTDDDKDVHKAGDFADTSLKAVRALVGNDAVQYHQGFIPQTFLELSENDIAFAHVDLDLHDAIYESCKFIYPRLVKGGVMVFDDYGFPSCPGARIAVDDFFCDKPEYRVVLPTAQAMVYKL